MKQPSFSLYHTKRFIRSFEKIVAYYREEVTDPDVGARFIMAVEESFKKITENPGRAPYYVPHPAYQDILETTFRAFQMKSFSPFSYILYYTVDDTKITLHYLFHSAQDRSHQITMQDFE